MSLSPSVESHNLYDVEAAAKIFLEHGDFIRIIIRQKVRSEVEAEDLFHDLFLSLATKPVPPKVQNVRSYLYRALSNDIIDSRRRIKIHQKAIQKHYAYSIYDKVNRDAESVLIDIEETVKLFDMVEKQLSSTEAKAVTLRYRENYTTEETAREMKVKPRTVSRYLSVGLSKLREFLSQVGEDNDDNTR